ncbi:MAG TPA: DUF2946 family protein [Tepidisphaeraceae bacterium]|nr:DUF2946 family protein [Tepidisphaeraceae bacterium]
MIRRVGIILLLLFEALWLNVVLPGHTRGAVALAGGGCGATSIDSCCSPARSAAGSTAAGGRSEAPDPSGDRASRCAVCAFAAKLTTPVDLDLRLPPLARVATLAVPAPPAVPTCDLHAAHYGRAPPAAA